MLEHVHGSDALVVELKALCVVDWALFGHQNHYQQKFHKTSSGRMTAQCIHA